MEGRSKPVTCKVTKSEREQLQRCAAEAGETLSSFLRNLIVQAIEETK